MSKAGLGSLEATKESINLPRARAPTQMQPQSQYQKLKKNDSQYKCQTGQNNTPASLVVAWSPQKLGVLPNMRLLVREPKNPNAQWCRGAEKEETKTTTTLHHHQRERQEIGLPLITMRMMKSNAKNNNQNQQLLKRNDNR